MMVFEEKKDVKDVHRKTVSFKGWIVDEINKRRGTALIEDGEDINFTEMVNYLLEKLFQMEKKFLRDSDV